MFELGAPLGWDDGYVENEELQKQFREMVKIEEAMVFHEILDSITLLHVIQQEIQTTMKAKYDE
jgi:hypothetical protein